MPTFCKAWPTARNPSGPISADTVITFGRRGAFRSDVSLQDIVAFINVIANGMALATSLGLELDAEAMLKLIHQGIDAK